MLATNLPRATIKSRVHAVIAEDAMTEAIELALILAKTTTKEIVWEKENERYFTTFSKNTQNEVCMEFGHTLSSASPRGGGIRFFITYAVTIEGEQYERYVEQPTNTSISGRKFKTNEEQDLNDAFEMLHRGIVSQYAEHSRKNEELAPKVKEEIRRRLLS